MLNLVTIYLDFNLQQSLNLSLFFLTLTLLIKLKSHIFGKITTEVMCSVKRHMMLICSHIDDVNLDDLID